MDDCDTCKKLGTNNCIGTADGCYEPKSMEITNSDFMDCLETAKTKMKKIEKQNTKIDFVQAEDLINRMALCIYDITHNFIRGKL